MTRRGVCIATDGFYVDVDISHGLGAVDDRQDVSRLSQRNDLTDRHPQPGRRDHVADADHFRLFLYRAIETLDDSFDIKILGGDHNAVDADTTPLLEI